MDLTEAPHISLVRPNSPPFRAALGRACSIVRNTGNAYSRTGNTYSRHRHRRVAPGYVTFERRVASGGLALRPRPEEYARQNGRPSCWAFTPDGIAVPQRYAQEALHKAADIDVTSGGFLAALDEIGKGFAAYELGSILEFNIADILFPREEGYVTSEETNEATGFQTVTFIKVPSEVLAGDWSEAACFSYVTGRPTVAGICSGGGARCNYRDDDTEEWETRDGSGDTVKDDD